MTESRTNAQNAETHIAQLKAQVEANEECGTTQYNLGVALLGVGKLTEAEGAFNEAISSSPNLAEAYVQLGGICLQRGDIEGCKYWNTRSTKARAGFAPGYGNLGFLALQEGNAEEAIKHLKKAIIHNTMFVQAYATLANAYMMTGLLDESIEASKKALEIEPNFAVAYNNLAIAYLEKGDASLADEHAKKAIELGYEVAPEILKDIKESLSAS